VQQQSWPENKKMYVSQSVCVAKCRQCELSFALLLVLKQLKMFYLSFSFDLFETSSLCFSFPVFSFSLV